MMRHSKYLGSMHCGFREDCLCFPYISQFERILRGLEHYVLYALNNHSNFISLQLKIYIPFPI